MMRRQLFLVAALALVVLFLAPLTAMAHSGHGEGGYMHTHDACCSKAKASDVDCEYCKAMIEGDSKTRARKTLQEIRCSRGACGKPCARCSKATKPCANCAKAGTTCARCAARAKEACGSNCTKPCCAKKRVKKARRPGCTKSCCAKEAKKARGPGCTKPCCAKKRPYNTRGRSCYKCDGGYWGDYAQMCTHPMHHRHHYRSRTACSDY